MVVRDNKIKKVKINQLEKKEKHSIGGFSL